ncbi:MAG: GDSL-type esterase/lipase family protein [Bacteroidota bacterium]
MQTKPINRFYRIISSSLLLIAGTLLFINPASGQMATWESLVKSVPCIRDSMNRISNDSVVLGKFFQKLHLLEEKSVRRINIVHIGDSHIQADNLSGTLRELLQLKFGNAGRGLVFPYAVARTNSQRGVRSSSTGSWESKRSVVLDNPLPIGISGFTLKTTSPDASIHMSVSDATGIGYRFNAATFFMPKGRRQYEMYLTDSSGLKIGMERENDNSYGSYTSSFEFIEAISEFTLNFKETDSIQDNAVLHGVLLENDSSGILYNTIGVNGAEFRHYSLASDFEVELPALYPDLIIVSLGTNEAYPIDFDSTLFHYNALTMLNGLRKACPYAEILITTPPDYYRGSGRRRMKNKDIRVVRNCLIDICTSNSFACWDLYEIMGGYGSISTWYSRGLVNRDYLHFQKKGYELQGFLLFTALMKEYGK